MSYTDTERTRLQGLIDADPQVQTILREIQAIPFGDLPRRREAQVRLQNAINRISPDLAQSSMGEGYQVRDGQVEREPGEWGRLGRTALIGAGMGLGAYGLGAALGGGASAAAAPGALGPSTPGNIAATTAATVPPASLAAGVGGVGAGSKILDALTSKSGAASLASLIPLLMRGGGNGGGSGDAFTNNAQLQSLLDMSVNRAQRTDPLHAAVTQLAMSRLPTNMQR